MTIEEWAKDFKSYVNEADMPREDYKGIMEYIDDAIVLLKEQNNCENCVMTIEYRQPVVRCRDCVHWDKECTEECDNSDSVCFHNGWCKPDWFCADGERKSD